MKKILFIMCAFIAASSIAASAAAKPSAPFQVIVDGKTVISAAEVSGIVTSASPSSSSSPAVGPKMPGIKKTIPMTLRGCTVTDAAALKWVLTPSSLIKSMTIGLYDENGKMLTSWTAVNAVSGKSVAGAVSRTSGNSAFESITFAADSVVQAK